VALSKQFDSRYKFDANIYNIRTNKFIGTVIFLDTGCFNTLIPKKLAKLTGRSLEFTMHYSLGGSLIEAEAFSINKLKIGDVTLERIIAFAGDYKGSHEDDIILGTNVINNWEMIINKKEHTFKFRENPPDSIANKKYIYQNYFNKNGKYIFVQDS